MMHVPYPVAEVLISLEYFTKVIVSILNLFTHRPDRARQGIKVLNLYFALSPLWYPIS